MDENRFLKRYVSGHVFGWIGLLTFGHGVDYLSGISIIIGCGLLVDGCWVLLKSERNMQVVVN